MSILLILCYNVSFVTWTIVNLTATKFKPLIFSTSGFALSYAANMFILMILYGFPLVARTVLLYNSIYMKGWEPCANRESMWILENFQWCGEPGFLGVAILRGRCLSLIPRRGKHKSINLWEYVPPTLSSEDGNMSSYLKVVFCFDFFFLEYPTLDEVEKLSNRV
jgi:hypothetical protein